MEEIGITRIPVIASFMALVVQLRCTTNYLFLSDSLITRELLPLFNVESLIQSSSKSAQPSDTAL